MKRILLLLLSCIAIFSVTKAEGYQVSLQSTRQTGMGHLGVAQKLGAESQFFNPAGLAFMQRSIDLSVGFSAVLPKATYTDKAGVKSENNILLSTPMYAYAAFKVSDKFSLGLSINTPYGSSLDWGKDWAGADLVQDISLQSFNFQPTAAYKISDNLSIGAGMMISFGSVELSRSLMPVGSMPLTPELTKLAPVSVSLDGKSTVSFGYNVGLMYDVNERLTLGASYRSCINMQVEEGSTEVTYANETVKNYISSAQAPSTQEEAPSDLFKLKSMIAIMDQGNFEAEMPMPANFTIGASYLVNDRLTLAGEVQTVFWDVYEELNLIFTEKSDMASSKPMGRFNTLSPKDYKNTIIIRLGTEYKITERTDIRAGIYFDQSPIQDDNYNPETPGMDKIGTSIGASFRPLENFSIDFAFLYVAGFGKDGYINNDGRVFEGEYTTHAIAPTLGLSYSF